MNFETTIAIDAPPTRVWDVISSIERWPEWIDTYQAARWLDSGMALGAKAEITQKRLPKLVYQVTRLDPGVEFTWETSSLGVRTVAVHTITPSADGRSILGLRLSQNGSLAAVAALLAGRQTRRYVQLEAERLKHAAEADWPRLDRDRDHDRYSAR